MAQTLTNFDEALKIDYLPVVREQLNSSTILLSRLQRNERDVSGKQWQQVAHYQRNSGIGAGTETGLPTAGQQGYKNPSGTVKYNRGRIQVSGPVMAASKNDKGAIVRALDSEIKGVTRDLKKEINYQLFNDGTAARALINGDPGTETTLTLDAPGTNYIFDGMLIDIVDPSTGVATTSGTSLVVTSVNSSTEVTMAVAANADVADNDVVTRAGATDGAGTSYEMMGIKGIVDDNTYVDTLHGISRTSFAWWNCSTFANDDNSGTLRDLTIPLMQEAVSAVEKNGGKVNLIVCDHDMRDAYAALVIADKRYVNTMDLDGGFKGLEFNGIPLVADPDAQPNTMFFLDTDHLQIMQMSDWSWMDKDGAVLSRVSGSDAYEAVLYWYADLTTDRPRAHSFLRDVQ
jgi:rhodanese-related sulfurtransferase